jgi:CheY-like chemotaxis protein
VRRTSFLALGLALFGFALQSTAQMQPKGAPPKSLAIYATFRELMVEGRFDLAANALQAFLDSNPSDADFLEIEKKHGTTAFTNLRTVPKWSDDPEAQKRARAAVEEAIKRSKAASDKLLRDPARVEKFVRNLGATYEERVYAELELKRIGDFAVPYMVDALRVTTDKAQYAGLLGAIKQLEGHTIAGWVAALDGLTPEQQYGVINSIATRPDVLNLQNFAQSDITPFLWRIMAQPKDQSPTFRALAEDLLNKLHPGAKADTKLPEVELTAIAKGFYDHTPRYFGIKTNPDGSPSTVPMWVWDAKTEKLSKVEDVPVGQAEEYYGLRYARWALERKPDYEPAQALILALAAERAMERAKFGNLATAEPATFKLLSDAPSPVIGYLLDRGMSQKKTALVLATIQVLSDRADRDAAAPPAGTPARPALLVKALTYPDPHVQFAAANALLRSPVEVPHEVRGQIVDILRRAAGIAPGAPADSKGTALLADPNKTRSDAIAHLLRGLGYQVEVFTTGRDLMRRIGRSSDFALIFIDHHIPNPQLIDLVGQLQVDTRAANRPTLVIASADKPRVPTFDQLLVRFAALIAATEHEIVDMPPPFVPDPFDESLQVTEKKREAAQLKRDGAFRNAAAGRIARLRRVVEATGVTFTPTQQLLFDLRLELITYAVLAAEFPMSPESSPATADHVAKLRKQIDLQPPSPPYGAGTPTTDLVKLIERFEIDLARVPTAQERFDNLYKKVDAAELGLPVERFRDPVIEARLARTLKNYPAVKIIPEPFSRFELSEELKAIFTADPTQAPRDPAAKKAAQKIAVEWLAKMATGALPGYEVKSAEPELRAALVFDDLADPAIDAVAKFGTAQAQQDLLAVALNTQRPPQIRLKAADATIRHIRVHGKSITKTLIDSLNNLLNMPVEKPTETDLAIRGKLLTLKGMLDYKPAEFLNALKEYNPPLLPPAPTPEPPKDPKEPKDPKGPAVPPKP